MTHRDFAVDLAQKAGVIMRENFLLGMKKEWKEDNSPVTATDKEINDMFVQAVKKNYPAYGIIAEEGGSTNGNEEFVWICDPVDGTMPFSHGIPTFVFAIALVRNGTPILGVVFDPIINRLFVAEIGKGATLNDEPIAVSQHRALKDSYTALESLTWWNDIGFDHVKILQQFVERDLYPFRLGTSIYTGVLVAAGELGACISANTFPWDCAAVKVIVEEAGGKVTDINGNDQRYDKPLNGLIVTNGSVHSEVLEILNTARIS